MAFVALAHPPAVALAVRQALEDTDVVKQVDRPATRALEALLQESSVPFSLCTQATNESTLAPDCNKRPFDFDGMFQAVPEYTAEFPTVEWCSDEDSIDDTSGGQLSILDKSRVDFAHGIKRRKLQTEQIPCLIRSKCLANGLATLASSIDDSASTPESSTCPREYSTRTCQY